MAPNVSENKLNWSDYNTRLVNSGRINLWIDEDLWLKWYEDGSDGTFKLGRPRRYSDGAIEFCVFLRYRYGLTYRSTEGFVQSLLELLGNSLKCPCYTQINKRQEEIAERLSKKLDASSKRGGSSYVLIDSTGLKVYGEGEWKVKKHGVGKRRTWRKLHLIIDASTQQIISAELTENSVSDEEIARQMIPHLSDSVKEFGGDGAFDDAEVYNKLAERNIKPKIPPDKNAVMARGRRLKENPGLTERNKILLEIQNSMMKDKLSYEEARKKWKKSSNYHQRSKVETAMYRFKTLLGDKLSSRKLKNQKNEALIKCAILNKLAA